MQSPMVHESSSHAASLRDDVADKQVAVRRVLIIEGLINTGLLGAKLFLGLSTNSLVILADAVHSVTDLANNILAWSIMKVADRPPDEDHPYGHRKFEVVAVFVLATLLSLVALELVLSSFNRSSDQVVSSSTTLIGLMFAVLMINLATAVWQNYMANKLDSGILKADASHTFSDVLTTIGVFAGWQLAAHGYPLLDSLATLVVAGIIVWMSFSLFRKTLPVLVDGVALPQEDIRSLISELVGIESVGRIRSRWVGDSISVDIVVCVNAAMNIDDAHKLADSIEDLLEREFDVLDTTVHVEPH